MMIACCIPMLVLAVILVAAGIVSAQYLLVALICTGAMAAMMIGMPGGHQHGGRRTKLSPSSAAVAESQVDPVCGMKIDSDTAAASSQYHKVQYFFCSASCKHQFERNPAQFVP